MRKITEQIATSFLNRETKSISHTKTDGVAVYLHGNKIAELTKEGLKVSLAGWNTVTTRERLNGIFKVFCLDAWIQQKSGEPYLNDDLIDSNDWYLIPFEA